MTQLPISPALSEAQPESLQELLSRDPQGYQQQDLARVIQLIRENRSRIVAANAGERRVKHERVKEIALPKEPEASAEELGF